MADTKEAPVTGGNLQAGGTGLLKEGFLRYEFERLIHGRAYFLNFTVHCLIICP